MRCPSCGSTNIQPFSVVYASGTQHIQASHMAVGSDGQVFQGSSHGSRATLLAQHCAPPAPPSPMAFIVAYGIGGIIIYLSMMICTLLGSRECVFVGLSALRLNWKQAAVGLAICGLGWLLMKGWYLQSKAYTAAKRQWQRSLLCYGCGQQLLR